MLWRCIGEWRYSSAISTSALDGGERSASCPGCFTPGTHWIVGWGGPRAGLNTDDTRWKQEMHAELCLENQKKFNTVIIPSLIYHSTERAFDDFAKMLPFHCACSLYGLLSRCCLASCIVIWGWSYNVKWRLLACLQYQDCVSLKLILSAWIMGLAIHPCTSGQTRHQFLAYFPN
jgi:hypothetical protein